MTLHAFALALLALVHVERSPVRACIERRLPAIVAAAEDAATRHGVPGEGVLALGWLESRWQCDPRSGGSVGAPVDRWHRHTAGPRPWDAAASALRYGLRRCGTIEGAISHFRHGLCVPGAHAGYVRRVQWLMGARRSR